MANPNPSRAVTILVLVLWYGAWAAIGILMAKPGLVGMLLALGAGVVAYLLMEVYAGGGISPVHLIAAIFVAIFSHGIARVLGLLIANDVI